MAHMRKGAEKKPRIRGMVLLEMHGHTRPLLGDPAAFYKLEIEAFAHWMGLKKGR